VGLIASVPYARLGLVYLIASVRILRRRRQA
jgi:hypothetical protein